MVVAEFAIIAFIDHAMVIRRSQFRDVALIFINPIQQGVKGGAQIEAATAAITDIIDPQRFFFEVCRIDDLQEAEFFHE